MSLTKVRARYVTFKLKAGLAITRTLFDAVQEYNISIVNFGAEQGKNCDAAINEAINFVFNFGGRVLIPQGEWLYTKIVHKKGVHVAGVGNRKSILKCVGGHEFSYEFEQALYPEDCTGCEIADLTLQGTVDAKSGLRWVGVNRSSTRNLRIVNFPVDGIYLDSPLEAEQFRSSYYNTHTNLQTDSNGCNIHFGKKGNWESGNSTFFFGGLSNLSVGTRGNIWVEGHANNVLISGMTVEALAGKYHIYHEGDGGAFQYHACRFENTGEGGIIKVTATARDVSFNGCLASGNVAFSNESTSTTVVGCSGFGMHHISERAKPLHVGGAALEIASLEGQQADVFPIYNHAGLLMFAVGKDGRTRVRADSSLPAYSVRGLSGTEDLFQVVGNSIFFGDGSSSPVKVLSYDAGAKKLRCDTDLTIPSNKYILLNGYYLSVKDGQLQVTGSRPEA